MRRKNLPFKKTFAVIDVYELVSLVVTDKDSKEIALTDIGGGKFTFTMPSGNVMVNARFEQVWENPFADISSDKWYYEAVKFVSKTGVMNGMGSGLFLPRSNLSRAQLAQILYNKENKPTVSGGSIFADVTGQWYTPAVVWANKQGVVTGYGNGLFGPNDNITREQLAVMLWRYAGKPTVSNNSLNFTDTDKVSPWALDAICWAVDLGVLKGKGNEILDPTGKATRAEAAQMLKNYLDK